MKLPTIILSIIILISCQKDISNQLIQPPNAKGKATKQVFPFTKYTTIKSYSFNKYPQRRIEKRLKDELDSLKKIDVLEVYLFKDDTINYKKHNRRQFELEQLFYIPNHRSILVEGQLLRQATYKKTLTENDLIQLNDIFHQPSKIKKPIPIPACAIYRDALIFYNENDEIVGTIEFCFQCQKVRFSTPTYKKVKGFQSDKWEQFAVFFKSLGHDMTYPKAEQFIYY